jgi:hypothetical protein
MQKRRIRSLLNRVRPVSRSERQKRGPVYGSGDDRMRLLDLSRAREWEIVVSRLE